jgi:hypothetical protein
MGFRRKLVVSSPVDGDVRARILADARAAWPLVVHRSARDACPERAVFAAPDMSGLGPAGRAVASDAFERAQEAGWKLEDELPSWSMRHPAVTFSYIDVAGAGAERVYEGFVCRAGRILIQREPGERAHVALLSRVGVVTGGPFAPFHPDYFRAGD